MRQAGVLMRVNEKYKKNGNFFKKRLDGFNEKWYYINVDALSY